jgi:hypothetical protein
LGRTRFNAFNFKSDPVRPEHWRYAPLFTLLMLIVETFSTVHVNSGEWFLHARNSKIAAFLPLHFKRKKQCDPWTINDFLIVTKLLFHVVCMETNREHCQNVWSLSLHWKACMFCSTWLQKVTFWSFTNFQILGSYKISSLLPQICTFSFQVSEPNTVTLYIMFFLKKFYHINY